MRETAGERDERIVEMLGKAIRGSLEHNCSVVNPRSLLDFIRAAGGDVTVPDLPEPKYTVTLTEEQRDMIVDITQKVRNGITPTRYDREKSEAMHMWAFNLKPDQVTS